VARYGRHNYIVQRYIRNPLLVNIKKSEVRFYFLIVNMNPLKVFIFPEGLVRVATNPHTMDDLADTSVHVLNVYQQRLHPSFDGAEVIEWNLSMLYQYIENNPISFLDKPIKEIIQPQIRKNLIHVIYSVLDQMCQVPESGMHFGLYGADFIIDNNYHTWLSEIQGGPSLSIKSSIKKNFVPEMLIEAVSIANDVRQRTLSGLPLNKLTSVDKFEVLIDE